MVLSEYVECSIRVGKHFLTATRDRLSLMTYSAEEQSEQKNRKHSSQAIDS